MSKDWYYLVIIRTEIATSLIANKNVPENIIGQYLIALKLKRKCQFIQN